MLGAGRYDRRVTFQRATTARSPLGGKTASAWTDLGSRQANVLFGTGAERRSAAVEQGTQAATFRLRLDSLTRTVTDQDRLTCEGLTYDITGLAPIGRTEIEITGVASRG